jgi:hypothetical protein
MLPELQITGLFMGNISKYFSMNCCLSSESRRTYLLYTTFVPLLSDFIFCGHVPLFFFLSKCDYELWQ